MGFVNGFIVNGVNTAAKPLRRRRPAGRDANAHDYAIVMSAGLPAKPQAANLFRRYLCLVYPLENALLHL